MLVHGRRTGPMGWATAVELGTLAIALAVLIGGLETVGAIAAAIATLIGRGAGISVLLPAVRRVAARYSTA
jgi:hypothetical protein